MNELALYSVGAVPYLYTVFFFKQKTAYELRISDWSSDVCSSDLLRGIEQGYRSRPHRGIQRKQRGLRLLVPRIEFGEIIEAKSIPCFFRNGGLAVETLAQGITRRQRLEPRGQRRFLLRYAARPQPTDEEARAALRPGRFVDAFDRDCQGRRHLYAYRSEESGGGKIRG